MTDERSRARLGRAACWLGGAFLSVAGWCIPAAGGTALASATPPALLSEEQVRAAIEVRLERMQDRRDRRQRQRGVPGGAGVPGDATRPPVIRRAPPPQPPQLLDRVDR
jgi:hypothetical protein